MELWHVHGRSKQQFQGVIHGVAAQSLPAKTNTSNSNGQT